MISILIHDLYFSATYANPVNIYIIFLICDLLVYFSCILVQTVMLSVCVLNKVVQLKPIVSVIRIVS